MGVIGERRQAPRVAPHRTPWCADAVLRPGQPVRLVNISRTGALIESVGRLRPGAAADLHLIGVSARQHVRGRVERCQVVGLDPLCYRGAIVFDERIELPEGSAPGPG